MALELSSLEAALRQPFSPAQIKFLPRSPKKDAQGHWVCMGLTYADKRVYEDRLNELAYGYWATPYTPPFVAGNKLIVPVTVVICGTPHTDFGEAFLTSPRKGEIREEENTATEAYSQGFRRACSQFGVGRYLYDLPTVWLPYDPEKRLIPLSREDRLARVTKLYREAGLAGIMVPSTTNPPEQSISAVFAPEQPAPTDSTVQSMRQSREQRTSTASNVQSVSRAGDGAASPTPVISGKQQKASDATLNWIKLQIQQDPDKLQSIYSYYQVNALEELPPDRVVHLINYIFQQQNQARRQTEPTPQVASMPAARV